MLNGGVMKSPDVDYFIMFHFVNDAPYGMEVQYGSASAAIGKMEVAIKGKSAKALMRLWHQVNLY